MKIEDQITAIAEACGYKHWFNGWNKREDNTPPLLMTRQLPDYLYHISARREAWNTLSIEQRTQLHVNIILVARRENITTEEVWLSHLWLEAFLCTVGKWEDNTP